MSNNIKVKMIVAQDIQTQQNNGQQQQVVINPIQVLRTPYIPTMLSIGVVFVVSGLNPKIQHTFSIAIKPKDNGKSIFESGKAQSIPNINPDNFVLSANLSNINVEIEGEYVGILTIDETEYDDSFFIYKTEQ